MTDKTPLEPSVRPSHLRGPEAGRSKVLSPKEIASLVVGIVVMLAIGSCALTFFSMEAY